jgi:hypothetical protein
MKMKPKDYEQLEQAIRKVQADYPDITAEAYADIDLSARRWRWDLVNLAIVTGYDIGTLEVYCNDDHIDTALRRITKTE